MLCPTALKQRLDQREPEAETPLRLLLHLFWILWLPVSWCLQQYLYTRTVTSRGIAPLRLRRFYNDDIIRICCYLFT
ncbi:hypothetical protein AV530_011595 [Patagioenas fasciata monilis]|uniref:Uncharacterized protein n=1 Tax=Patagioenas fasciata monilis TaxID=372326 RepID=A0A1V4J5H0_PATFA|nr:hypothetical protein AV530_011595 [Patagioenas fasciata monilis]